MRTSTIRSLLLMFLFEIASSVAGDVVINEIHYNPPDGAQNEFLELYNPTAFPIDLTGYTFSSGLTYTFPAGRVIEPGGYLLVVKNPWAKIWIGRNLDMVGPYQGKLSNAGEKITLQAPDGRTVDSLTYDDTSPWPRGADGYGSSLERISPDLPSKDFHSWRASVAQGGTPGAMNSVSGVPARPVITAIGFSPNYPTSNDEVIVRITLDASERIDHVKLQIEPTTTKGKSPVVVIPMVLVQQDLNTATFEAVISPNPSQTLVRFNAEVNLKDGRRVRLPHSAEPRPCESYFVYDGDAPAKLPLLWLFVPQETGLIESRRQLSGVVVKPVTAAHVQVFDGARVLASHNGQKIKFLKGEEYRGDRTINLIPESPPIGTTAGPQSPHVEQISFRLFRDFGVLAPRCDWYRVIERTETQRIAIQQPNERFLGLNGRDDNGNIYKIAYNEWKRVPNVPGGIGYVKQTNTDEGDEDLFQLTEALYTQNAEARATALRRYLVVDEVMAYSVASVLMSNWDGFHNNLFLYHNPPPVDRWECIPWDLDKTFGFTDTNHMFVEMPLTYPLNGRAAHASRTPGLISHPFHMDRELNEEYLRLVRKELDGLFSEERVSRLIQETETLLLDDLSLQEQRLGHKRDRRRSQIQQSYETMRTFLRLRHAYLRAHLPTAVDDWDLW